MPAKPETEAPEIVRADWAHLVPPIFAECVGDDVRFNLGRPFTDGDHLYATDGRIVVRMPTPEGWSIPNPARAPKASVVFEGVEFEPLARLVPAMGRPCELCSGTGHRPEHTCPKCEGGGVVECDCDCPKCDGEDDCGECDGKGVVPAGPCDPCKETGLHDPTGPAEVAPGFWCQRRYLAVLHREGATVYLPMRKVIDPIRFVVGDAEGRLMPLDSSKLPRGVESEAS